MCRPPTLQHKSLIPSPSLPVPLEPVCPASEGAPALEQARTRRAGNLPSTGARTTHWDTARSIEHQSTACRLFLGTHDTARKALGFQSVVTTRKRYVSVCVEGYRGTHTQVHCGDDTTRAGAWFTRTTCAVTREISRARCIPFLGGGVTWTTFAIAHGRAPASKMPGGKKTIVDVRVKDLEKWRYPSKHYVRIMSRDGLGSGVLSGQAYTRGWWVWRA